MNSRRTAPYRGALALDSLPGGHRGAAVGGLQARSQCQSDPARSAGGGNLSALQQGLGRERTIAYPLSSNVQWTSPPSAMSWAPGRAGSRVTPDGRPMLPPTPSRGPKCTYSRTSTTEILNIIVLCNILRSRCLHNKASIMLRIGPRVNCPRSTNVARRLISPPGLGAKQRASLRPRSGLCLAHLYSLKPAAEAAVSLL